MSLYFDEEGTADADFADHLERTNFLLSTRRVQSRARDDVRIASWRLILLAVASRLLHAKRQSRRSPSPVPMMRAT